MSAGPARFSRLPVLQYCGQSQLLGEQGAGSRASAIGSAFHAKCAALHHPEHAMEALALYSRLSDDERALVDELIPPTDVEVNGHILAYETATKEHPCALYTAAPEGVARMPPRGEQVVAVQGTTDLFWIHEDIAYVADIKRTSFTAPDGPASLQVIGYAISVAEEYGCQGYYPGIWDATEGEWLWGAYVDVWSEEAEGNRKRVLAAALNHGGEYNVGTHCSGCYARSKCPQFLLPLDLVGTSLEPFTRIGGITNENAVQALVLAQRAADTAKAVRGMLEQYARDNGGVLDVERNKVWKPCKTKGRASLDRKALETAEPELAQRYMKFGVDFETFKWVNAPKGGK